MQSKGGKTDISENTQKGSGLDKQYDLYVRILSTCEEDLVLLSKPLAL